MASVELKYVCRHDRTLKMANTGTCELKKAKARRNENDATMHRCRMCPGPLPLDSPEARQVEPPPPPKKKPAAKPAPKPAQTCKYHPDRPAEIDKNGRSQGVCQECLAERTAKARAALKKSWAAKKAKTEAAKARAAKAKAAKPTAAQTSEAAQPAPPSPEPEPATAPPDESPAPGVADLQAKVLACEAKIEAFDAKHTRAREEIEREARAMPPAAIEPAPQATPGGAMLGRLLSQEVADLEAALTGQDDCVLRARSATVCRIAKALGEAGALPGWEAA